MNLVYLFVIVNNVIHIVMKSGKCLLMLLMILFSPMAFAQQSGVNVTGSVVEQGSDTPIEQATVRLLNVKDSAMVRGVVSARNGSFTLKNVKKKILTSATDSESLPAFTALKKPVKLNFLDRKSVV